MVTYYYLCILAGFGVHHNPSESAIPLDGNVRVVVDLPLYHQFASAIKEEIMEKIELLWDVKEVTVEFVEQKIYRK